MFAALADPTRRDIIARLTLGEAGVNELAAPYGVSLQAISKHVKVLEAAGLVTRSRAGQRRPVHLEADALSELTGWIEQHQRRAEERYQRLDAVLADLTDSKADTNSGCGSGSGSDSDSADVTKSIAGEQQ